ncbi:TVP38/TMEM64 family protein [Roseomonas sp. CCTCC AB2023176]|uniref:TVP38/TMEM64 family protein n=1 Tax=Roseomonas sp. CCTCC AB2023176 TaxID=3342640 RepID=UPI0035DF9DEA
MLGATTGAVLVFLAARYALADWLEARFGRLLSRIRPGLQRDGFSYLLALRLLPLLPFWLVNLAPALMGMRLRTFAAATAIGIIPGSFVFASVGAGIGGILADGRRPDLSVILQPSVLLPLLGLALLALAPVAYRHWKGRRGSLAGDA